MIVGCRSCSTPRRCALSLRERRAHAASLLAVATALALHGPPSSATSLAGDWPTRVRNDGGYEVAIKGLYQYQVERVGGDGRHPRDGSPWLADLSAWRRKEFGISARAPWGLELNLGYDFTQRNGRHVGWIDNYLRYRSPGHGEFRLGQFKTPVGWEEATSSGATTFLERALPVQATSMGRRLGIDWTWRPTAAWLLQVGYFAGGDLNGENDGHGPTGRLVWTPFAEANGGSDARADRVLHVGLALSREMRRVSTDRHGTTIAPSARFRARPETGLNDARLVDTGHFALPGAIARLGLEFAWIEGPLLMQGEYLRLATQPQDQPRFKGQGGYLQVAWLATGERRAYAGGAVGNVRPDARWGAIELGLRYSALDLDDGPVRGGRQHDWTLGANWYLGERFKFQINYVRGHAERDYPAPLDHRVTLEPDILEARMQIQF